jgi:hypothetical protein
MVVAFNFWADIGNKRDLSFSQQINNFDFVAEIILQFNIRAPYFEAIFFADTFCLWKIDHKDNIWIWVLRPHVGNYFRVACQEVLALNFTALMIL